MPRWRRQILWLRHAGHLWGNWIGLGLWWHLGRLTRWRWRVHHHRHLPKSNARRSAGIASLVRRSLFVGMLRLVGLLMRLLTRLLVGPLPLALLLLALLALALLLVTILLGLL